MIAVVTLALLPNLRLPPLFHFGEYSDAIYHMTGFFVLTAMATLMVGKMATALVSMAALSIGLEGLQAFVPGREVFLSDVIASLTGVGFGALFMFMIKQPWRRRVHAVRY